MLTAHSCQQTICMGRLCTTPSAAICSLFPCYCMLSGVLAAGVWSEAGTEHHSRHSRHELRPDGAMILRRRGEEEMSNNSSSTSEEETSDESSPERRSEVARRSLRRRREEHPDDLDFRETTPGQRLPTPRRARPRTRTGSAHAARQTESARPLR